jgi:dihydrofolate reductase
MRKIVVLSFISLDGVMQAPGGSEEDKSEGFQYGGWSFPYFDESSGEIMGEQIKPPLDLLLGRKTYDIFAGYWPKQDASNPVTEPFNQATKYVVTHQNDFKTDWEKSVVVSGDDVVAKLKELKEQDGPTLQVHGSGNLVQTLLANDLVDELWLKIFPVTLGPGKRLFQDGAIPAGWELTDSTITSSGVIFASYKRAGEVKTGSFT